MQSVAIDLSATTLEVAFLAGFCGVCLILYLRKRAVLLLLFCLLSGLLLAALLSNHLRFDAEGVAQSELFARRRIAWADIAAARFETHKTKQGEAQDLRLVSRKGDVVVEGVDQLGPEDAATLADFLAARLPEPYGRMIREKLPALQTGMRDRQYRFSTTPGG